MLSVLVDRLQVKCHTSKTSSVLHTRTQSTMMMWTPYESSSTTSPVPMYLALDHCLLLLWVFSRVYDHFITTNMWFSALQRCSHNCALLVSVFVLCSEFHICEINKLIWSIDYFADFTLIVVKFLVTAHCLLLYRAYQTACDEGPCHMGWHVGCHFGGNAWSCGAVLIVTSIGLAEGVLGSNRPEVRVRKSFVTRIQNQLCEIPACTCR